MGNGKVEILIIESIEKCDQCVRAEEVAYALAQKDGDISVRVITVLDPEADRYGVVMTPTVVVNGVIISVRRAPDPERLEMLIEKIKGGVVR
ncbi:MAG: thioredoxin family protein [Armatimonadetes bacterium]|nr:thioredoxin family protein [Armatimonadota bacterium]MDW8122098.1 thioredoxin family protein [Armatimonadota bacterium]